MRWWHAGQMVRWRVRNNLLLVKMACCWLWRHNEASAGLCKLEHSTSTYKHRGQWTREWLFRSGTRALLHSAVCLTWVGLLSCTVWGDIMHIPSCCVTPCPVPGIMDKRRGNLGALSQLPSWGVGSRVRMRTQARPFSGSYNFQLCVSQCHCKVWVMGQEKKLPWS